MITSQGIHPARLENPLLHKATITKKVGIRPFHAQCSCGPAGDFFDLDSAKQYLGFHQTRVVANGMGQFELQDLTQAPPPKPAAPAPAQPAVPAPPKPPAPEAKESGK